VRTVACTATWANAGWGGSVCSTTFDSAYAGWVSGARTGLVSGTTGRVEAGVSAPRDAGRDEHDAAAASAPRPPATERTAAAAVRRANVGE
jgi:hypothetical protein